MRITSYLIIKKTSPYRASVRVTKTTPNLDFNEVSMKLNLEVPDELFSKPRLEASIAIPKEAVSPEIIEADVIDNIQDTIKQNTGVEVKLNLVSQEKE